MTNSSKLKDQHIALFFKQFRRPFLSVMVIIFAVLLIAAMYDGPVNKNSPAGKFLYDYQALVVGILAVLASAATITQMRSDNAEQTRQNRLLVKLMIRPEANLVRKQAYYNLERKQRITDAVHRIDSQDYQRLCFRKKNLELFPVLNAMSEFLKEYEGREGVELYSPDSFHKLTFMQTHIVNINDALAGLSDAQRYGPPDYTISWLKSKQSESLIVAENLIRQWEPHYALIADNLQEMLLDYEEMDPIKGKK